MLCPSCSNVLPDTATNCTACGTNVVPATEPANPYQAAGTSPYAPVAAAEESSSSVGGAGEPYAAAQQAAQAAPQAQAATAYQPVGQSIPQGQPMGQAATGYQPAGQTPPQGQTAGGYQPAGQTAPQGQPGGYQYQAPGQQAYQQPGAPYGQPYQQPGYGYNPYQQPSPAHTLGRKNHIVAGLLGIFFGSLGIHKFYLEYSKAGLIMLLVTLLGSLITFGLAALVMAVIGLIEGVMYLVKTDEEFYYTYELTTKEWF